MTGLTPNLLLFGRVLRGLGLDVSPGRMRDLVVAVDHVGLARRADFRDAARCLLVHRHEDVPLFEAAFEAFWRKPAEGWTTLDLSLLGPQLKRRGPIFTPPPLRPPGAPPEDGGDQSAADDQPPVVQVTLTYSSREALRRKDFSELSGEELEAIKRLMAHLIWELGERRTRRRRPGHGQLPDLRRTIRRNLKYGGDVIEWATREPKFKPRPIVIIADISGSMERYTRLFLHFIYSLTSGLDQPVESFVFSTRLTRITHELRNRDVDQALRDVANAVNDWSGGTRIGEALKAFNFARCNANSSRLARLWTGRKSSTCGRAATMPRVSGS